MKVSKLENKNGYQRNCEFRDEILQKIPGDRSDADNNFLYFMEDLDALVEESKRMHEYLKERQVAGNLKHCKDDIESQDESDVMPDNLNTADAL